jgi:hypothetical protein
MLLVYYVFSSIINVFLPTFCHMSFIISFQTHTEGGSRNTLTFSKSCTTLRLETATSINPKQVDGDVERVETPLAFPAALFESPNSNRRLILCVGLAFVTSRQVRGDTYLLCHCMRRIMSWLLVGWIRVTCVKCGTAAEKLGLPAECRAAKGAHRYFRQIRREMPTVPPAARLCYIAKHSWFASHWSHHNKFKINQPHTRSLQLKNSCWSEATITGPYITSSCRHRTRAHESTALAHTSTPTTRYQRLPLDHRPNWRYIRGSSLALNSLATIVLDTASRARL